jgi:hypothetical protein
VLIRIAARNTSFGALLVKTIAGTRSTIISKTSIASVTLRVANLAFKIRAICEPVIKGADLIAFISPKITVKFRFLKINYFTGEKNKN